MLKQMKTSLRPLMRKFQRSDADLDHCGLLPLFDEVYSSSNTRDCLMLEFLGKAG